MSTHLTNITDLALDRLPLQYREKPLIAGLLTALVQEFQNLEDTFFDLKTMRMNIDLAEGNQLDRLGAIVGQPRDGLDDPAYRSRIRLRIAQNLSQGEPNRLIDVYAVLIGASVVMLQENYPAGVSLMANAEVMAGQETIIYRNMQSIAPAGVRIDYLGSYHPTEAFSFDGGADGAGFGDLTAPSVGGQFAKINIPFDIDFQLQVGSDLCQGFGDVRDSGIGGLFESL